MHHGELALSPALLEELRQRLAQTVAQIMEVIREEEMGHRAMERLGRLIELSAFLKKEPATGDVRRTPTSAPHKIQLKPLSSSKSRFLFNY